MALTQQQFEMVILDMHSGLSLKKSLEKHQITATTFYNAVESNHFFNTAYASAQRARAELLADEVVDIADTELDPQRARNRMDARRWYASKMQPQKYGDRIDLNITERVDIGGAIAEAKRRALPSRFPEDIEDAEIVVTQQLPSPTAADTQSVDALKSAETGDATQKRLADLLK